jgi:hypothetical protein
MAALSTALEAERVSGRSLEAALEIKRLAGQINVVIHALGILVSLPHLLEPDEVVEELSLGAGNTGRSFDLTTDRRIAAFKFITWRGGAEAIRQNTVFVDVLHLAEADTDRARFLYVTGSKDGCCVDVAAESLGALAIGCVIAMGVSGELVADVVAVWAPAGAANTGRLSTTSVSAKERSLPISPGLSDQGIPGPSRPPTSP